jgi:hypothetical protein
MKILAIDPGGTTGLAWGFLDGQEGLEFTTEQLKLAHMGLYNYLVDGEPDWIVYETFEYRNRARAGLELISAELIGVIKLYLAERDIKVSTQSASEHGAGGKKGYYTNQKFKAMGIYKAKPHEMDALRILLTWYKFKAGFQFFKGDAKERHA